MAHKHFDGSSFEFKAIFRLDSKVEIKYYRHSVSMQCVTR